MKTVTYIVRGTPERAQGGAGRTGGHRRGGPSGGDKVVDLTAWRAEHLMEPEGPEADTPPARRAGWTAADWAELAATLAMTVAFLALAARVLL